MQRRELMRTAGALALTNLAGLPAALAQEDPAAYPTRPIRVMIGFAPGGSTDAPMRVLAEAVSKILGQPVVIENKPGAAGVIPTQMLQAASPDGYTLAVAPAGVYRLPYTTDIKWSPASDLAYLIGLSGYAFGTVVPASSPIRSMAEYIAYAKANPDMLTYSSPGVGTTNHLTMEQFSRAAGVKLNHVPYKGSAESLQALLAGHVQSAAETSAFVPHVESGKLRLLAVWSDKRMARFPDVPTLRELGIDIVQTSPWGLVAPKGTHPKVQARLHDAFRQAMEMPAFKASLARFDMEPDYRDPAQYQRFAVASMKREKDILDTLGLSRK
ncbi:tripartite tricarboxylate transporter substrate binding protein [Variovorax sp. KK3]|uniref:Bug family tripartite tricarboxylate transporter substrate binding protein n=1 Tax=Variovorax sp. KK3 TaxID=1855728 RepID=UPI00097BC99A|nr:tripartite tricarboxylate transporter substrate binding protein [Variovorax sp. KK3]